MITICNKCKSEFNWSPSISKCPFCNADEKEIEVYNEVE